MSTNQSPTATTDVAEFMTDLDGGVFDRMLSIALSETAAAAVDHDKVGEVTVKFTFKKIPGTTQVHCQHALKFSRPTEVGKRSEEATRTTPLHVGKGGRLTLSPENQMAFLDKRTGNVTA